MSRLWLVALVVVIMTGSVHRAKADDEEYSRKTLKGLTTFMVSVYVNGEDSYVARIDTTSLRAVVELRLRKNGLRVLKYDTEIAVVRKVPLLMVGVSGFSEPGGYCVSDARIEVDQLATLLRDPSIMTVVGTWNVESARRDACSDVEEKATTQIRGLLDQFMNAYLSANPRGATR